MHIIRVQEDVSWGKVIVTSEVNTVLIIPNSITVSGGGHAIENNGTPVVVQPNLNFVGFTITDDPVNSATVITTTAAAQEQADWTQADNTQVDFIKNKPSIPSIAGLATDADVLHKTTAAEISVMTDKPTPVDADVTMIEDSATSPTAFGKKKVTFLNLWLNYFKGKADALYSVLGHTHAYATNLLTTVNPIGNLGATPTIDFATGYIQTGTHDQAITAFTLANCPVSIPVRYREVSGNFAHAWDTNIRWQNGVVPVHTTAAGYIDEYVFIKQPTGNLINGFYAPKYATT